MGRAQLPGGRIPHLLQHVRHAGHGRLADAGHRPVHGGRDHRAGAPHGVRGARPGQVRGRALRQPLRGGHLRLHPTLYVHNSQFVLMCIPYLIEITILHWIS